MSTVGSSPPISMSRLLAGISWILLIGEFLSIASMSSQGGTCMRNWPVSQWSNSGTELQCIWPAKLIMSEMPAPMTAVAKSLLCVARYAAS